MRQWTDGADGGRHCADAKRHQWRASIGCCLHPAPGGNSACIRQQPFGYLEVEPDIIRNTLDSIERLRALGAEVIEVDLDWPAGIERAYYGHMDPLFFSAIAEHLEHERDLLCDYNVQMAEQGLQRQLQDPAAYYKAVCIESRMYQKFSRMMELFDAFVCPTVTSNRLSADFNPAVHDYVVNGKTQEYDLGMSTCHIFNMMGRCPAISVPSGIGDNGVPTGLHIASTAYDDVAVFRVAAAMESSWNKQWRPAL